VLWSSPRWDTVCYWCLDLETGGLDTARDPIIEVGMVPVREGTVRLGESYSSLVRLEGGVIQPASVQAHQLVPSDVREAPPLAQVMREVEQRLREGPLLVHQAAIDVRFLKRAYGAVGLRWARPTVVDTVDLIVKAAERSRFLDPTVLATPPPLNLAEARRRYGLPDYGAHDALTDAVSTAELFLVLRRALGARTLRDLR
jgi:DNA polymerase III subunit epsilon